LHKKNNSITKLKSTSRQKPKLPFNPIKNHTTTKLKVLGNKRESCLTTNGKQSHNQQKNTFQLQAQPFAVFFYNIFAKFSKQLAKIYCFTPKFLI